MYKTNRFHTFNEVKSQKHAIEGSFCSYTHRTCMQNRLEGYDYCLKHILEDKNAPFKQCSYKSAKTGKGCLNAALKSEKKDGYCLEHARRTLLMRQRAARKKRPKETPETLLEGLDIYSTQSLQTLHEQDIRKIPSIASKALEYASSSDSDAETPLIDQAWRGDGDSDAESIDSEQEDPLKHAGVYTAEEVALIMKDKLIRLQSLYIDQFKRLQHVMKEKRRKYLHTVKKEKESLGGLGQYAKDHDSRENLARFNAMKRYHRRFSVEALLQRQSKERRIAASEGSSYRQQPIVKCMHNHLGQKCVNRTLPLSKYCIDHILDDPHQVLYRPCIFGDEECKKPVVHHLDTSYCTLHSPLQTFHPRIGKQKDYDHPVQDEIIDVTSESAMETSHDASHDTVMVTPGTSTQQTTPSVGNGRLDPDIEEALMKKGKYLLQHLKNIKSGAE